MEKWGDGPEKSLTLETYRAMLPSLYTGEFFRTLLQERASCPAHAMAAVGRAEHLREWALEVASRSDFFGRHTPKDLPPAIELLARRLTDRILEEVKMETPTVPEAIPPRDLKTTYRARDEGQPARVVIEHKPSGKHFEGEGATAAEALESAKAQLAAALTQ